MVSSRVRLRQRRLRLLMLMLRLGLVWMGQRLARLPRLRSEILGCRSGAWLENGHVRTVGHRVRAGKRAG